MENSKLIQVLGSFCGCELIRFGEFINSPFFNKNSQVIALYDILRKCHPDFGTCCTKEEVFSKLFPSESYNDEKLRNLMSDLLVLAEKFLAYLNYEKDEFDFYKYLLNELGYRELDKAFRSEHRQAQSVVNKSAVKDEKYYLKHFLLHNIYREFHSDNNKHSIYYKDFHDEMEFFNIYALVRMLKYFCIISNEERRVQVKIEKYLYDEVMNYLEDNLEHYEDIPAIQIFYNLLRLNQSNNQQDHFNKLNSILAKNRDFVETEDLKSVHIEIHNFCGLKCATVESEFDHNCFRLIKSAIKKGMFPHRTKFISDHTYICLISTGLETKDFDWTENFIHEFKSKLSPQNRENAYNYALAILNFYKGNCQESLRILSESNCANFYYYLRIKNLILKNNYELNNLDEIPSKIEALRKFLSRNESVPVNVKTKYLNYLKFLTQLCSTKFNKNGMTAEILLDELSDCKDVENKSWLLEKTAELTNSTARNRYAVEI